MSKFGVSYNVFSDSLELLEHSCQSIRNHVDYISVVYQKVSNTGQPSTEPIEDVLNELVTFGLVDELYLFKPKVDKGSHANEIEKRKIGSFISANAGCQYHMCADSDELYIGEQLEYIKNIYITEKLVGGYCQMQTFYKSSRYRFKTPEEYYISLFYDVSQGHTYEWNAPCQVLVDPTRKISIPGPTKIFSRQEIEMLHLSGVRKNYRAKLESSSAAVNFHTEIDRLVDHYDRFDFASDPRALWPGCVPCQYHELVEVLDDKFNISF